MKKLAAMMVTAVLFSVMVVSAEEGSEVKDIKEFMEKQKQEREEFKKDLKEQREEDKEAAEDKHAANVAFLRERLADSKLTDGQKEEIVNMLEEHYGKHVELTDRRLKDLIRKIQKLSNDDSKSMPEKKAALKKYIAEQKLDIMKEKQEKEEKAEKEKNK